MSKAARRKKRLRPREERRLRRKARRRMLHWLYGGLVGTVGLAVILSLLIPQLPGPGASPPRSGGPGRVVPVQEAIHIQPGEPHPPYNTKPPTSGWRYPTTARWGIHSSPIPDEVQVHNLEHGGVLIQYNTDDQELIRRLEELARSFPNFPCYLIVAPYPDMPHTIALTAWGVIDTMDDLDEGRIRAFVEAYRDRGPEKVPCVP